MFVDTSAVPVENALLANYSPRTWRGTAFGAKFVLSLGISALAVPMVALIYEFTGGFFWLFVILGCLAATVVAAAPLLPADKQTVVGMAARPALD